VEIIQEIGSYAGIAAVVGLAVLSALYFSQARDLRRLREWAGRAPERAAESEARILAATEAAEAAARAAATPAAAQAREGQAAAAAEAGAGPQTAVLSAPAAEAGQEAPAEAPSGNGASAPPEDEEAAAEEKEAAPAGAEAGSDDQRPAVAAATPAAGARRPLPPPRPIPSPPGRTPPRIPSATVYASATAPRQPWYRRVGAGRLALAALATLLVAGAAVAAVTQLRDEPGGNVAAGGGGESAQRGSAASPTDPADVTFAVLNGTTVNGLARRFADRLEAAGYRRGNVTNASEQAKAESVVLYAANSRRVAQSVARRLDIGQLERIDPRSQELAGDATVVVVLGNDKVSAQP
jgi:LytR cell envelope-related transcriptional attenuator